MQLRKYSMLLFQLVMTYAFLPACTEQSGRNDEAEHAKIEGPKETLFNLLAPEATGVKFNNVIKENASANILNYQYFYNGGGVAVGDVNNDGLVDLYFSGNITSNRLYLNKGNMEFEDITLPAGVGGKGKTWKTGVSMADVNGDGLLDIYVCYSGNLDAEGRMNQLFINQGLNEQGIPVFEDLAEAYGLADSAYSTHAIFFDYDLDGDLDMFLLNHNPYSFESIDEFSIRENLKSPAPNMRVKLYRHNQASDGSPSFSDVSDEAGLPFSAFSHGLGAGIADVNQDGWPDIFVSNDYSTPDFLLINNGDGTFTDKLQASMGHTSLFSMGNDIADINNNGLADIFVLDMLPADNRRQKLLFTPDNYEQFDVFLKAGFHYQYMRNMLHINTGLSAEGAPVFSEAGQLAGISNTDWSWAPLLADYDNDGWKDVFVSNGFLKDLTNLDFIKYSDEQIVKNRGNLSPQQYKSLLDRMPSTNVSNYIFKNNTDLTFSNKGADWGVNLSSNSNGAAYADLDNDGDLDLITNNINQSAFIYQNTSSEKGGSFLQLKLQGSGKNTAGVGAKVRLFAGGQQQYQEQMPNRGYQSSVSPVLHFGLGEVEIVDSLQIVWPGGLEEWLMEIPANQVLVLEEKNAARKKSTLKKTSPTFVEVKSPVNFIHPANLINDFKRQPLLVNPVSFSGPCLVKVDVNGDGLEDIFAGGGTGQAATLYIQQKNGNFQSKTIAAFEADKNFEDTDALFFDANRDGLLDLYVASGGYGDLLPEDSLLQDRLYLNDGKGSFIRSDALPAMLTSSSCVRSADINGDGSPDLFVGGRVIPGRYPEAPRSYVLLNNGQGEFKDMTATLAPQLQQPGMVTDAAWHDLNGNGDQELIVVGEWMSIQVYAKVNGKFSNQTNAYFDKRYTGWWNTLLLEDFNQDGNMDLIVGNMGTNTQVKVSESEPAELYFKDFDDNGAVDPILCFYIQGTSYPYVTRDELLDQISSFRTRFPNYQSYADATIHTIFTPEQLEDAGRLSANYLKTAYFEGSGNGRFSLKVLPVEAQLSPAFALLSLDYDQDGHQDLLIGGNINQARLRFGKYDANYGVLLKGDGEGGFTYVPQGQSGFGVKGDVRSIVSIKNTLLFGINQEEIKAYKLK